MIFLCPPGTSGIYSGKSPLKLVTYCRLDLVNWQDVGALLALHLKASVWIGTCGKFARLKLFCCLLLLLTSLMLYLNTWKNSFNWIRNVPLEDTFCQHFRFLVLTAYYEWELNTLLILWHGMAPIFCTEICNTLSFEPLLHPKKKTFCVFRPPLPFVYRLYLISEE